MFKVPEKYRITTGPLGRPKGFGNAGAFNIPLKTIKKKISAFCIASDGMGWEHVSVSIQDSGKVRTPTWDEMCKIKSKFWDDDDCVVQYHPPKKDYINNHPNVLHLWRPVDQEIPRPPKKLVGV